MNLDRYRRKITWNSYYYAIANGFITDLRQRLMAGKISYKEFKELKSMAISGNLKGAKQALIDIEVAAYDR